MDDLESCNSTKNFWLRILQLRMSIVCFKEDSDEIVAINFLLVRGKEESKELEDEIRSLFGESEAILNMLRFCDYFETICPSANDYFGVNKYLFAIGLGVNRRYRKRGIATEMLKARYFGILIS